MKTKSLGETQKAYEEAIPRAAANYKTGIQAASNVIEASKAAEENWKAGMQDAIGRNARLKGLEKVTDADWKKAALEKGAPRIGGGMTASKEKYNRGMGEVLSVLQGITLPPRTTDPMANVTNRVGTIAVELHKLKTR